MNGGIDGRFLLFMRTAYNKPQKLNASFSLVLRFFSVRAQQISSVASHNNMLHNQHTQRHVTKKTLPDRWADEIIDKIKKKRFCIQRLMH